MNFTTLKTGIRKYLRQKFSTSVTLLSLIVGLTTVSFISIWLLHETSFDSFHEKSDRIYRIAYYGRIMDNEIATALTSRAFYEALSNDFPEVEEATLISTFGNAILTKPDGVGHSQRMIGVNPDFFKIFSVSIIKGDATKLEEPNTAFITRKMAVKFFGDEEPIGKILSTGMDRSRKNFTVVGVVESFPENSHFQFDMLYSNTSQSWYRRAENDWLNAVFYNYILLKPNADPKEFEEKFNHYVNERIALVLKAWQNISFDEWQARGEYTSFRLQPLNDIHLYSSLDDELSQNGNIVYVSVFLGVGILVLLISVINFSNLATVEAMNRKKEVGVRKVSGSSGRQILIQHLMESCMLSFLALIMSMLILVALYPLFQNFAETPDLPKVLINIKLIGSLFGITLISGILGGIYPALFLSRQMPARIFSGSSGRHAKNFSLNDYLVIAQFSISLFVIISALFIHKQLSFMQNQELGFTKENILVIEGTENLSHEHNKLLNRELQKIAAVKASSSSNYLPSGEINAHMIYLPNAENNELKTLNFLPCDKDFKNVYLFELKKGRFFEETDSENSRKVVINQKAAKILPYKNPIGKIIRRSNHDYQIIGVISDFHFESKIQEIAPLAIVQLPDTEEFWPPLFCSVRFSSENVGEVVQEIETTWKNVTGGADFNYSFFSERYDRLYRHEMQIHRIFLIFSLVAVILSCLGLLGFVKYLIRARTKEVGIRKVNGARRKDIFRLFSKYFGMPVFWAFAIAAPLTYWGLTIWLSQFAYRIDLNLTFFVLGGVITLSMAILTTGVFCWKAANYQPVHSLRHE